VTSTARRNVVRALPNNPSYFYQGGQAAAQPAAGSPRRALALEGRPARRAVPDEQDPML
jgi:hypothetical protein